MRPCSSKIIAPAVTVKRLCPVRTRRRRIKPGRCRQTAPRNSMNIRDKEYHVGQLRFVVGSGPGAVATGSHTPWDPDSEDKPRSLLLRVLTSSPSHPEKRSL